MVKNEQSRRDMIFLCLHFVWFEFRALQNWVLFFCMFCFDLSFVAKYQIQKSKYAFLFCVSVEEKFRENVKFWKTSVC